MLRKIWYVAAKDLLQLTKDRMGLVLLIIIPLALMGVLGSLVSGLSSGSTAAVPLPVVNHDTGSASLTLIDALRHTPTLNVQLTADENGMKQAVRDGNQVGLLIIPAGFTAALQSPQPAAQLTYYAVSGNSDQRAIIASTSVQDMVQRFSWATVTSDAVAAAQRPATGKIDPALTAQLTAQASSRLDKAPPVALQTINAAGRATNVQDQTVPGYALMFALFGITAGAGSLLEEKESGTVKRLLIAPLPPLALLGGKALALFVQSVAQLSLLFGLGALLFKINLGPSLPALALLIVGTSVAATGLGMILVSFVRTQRQLRPITTLVTLGFSAIGGSWFPIAMEPQWMQNVSKVSLNAWAMQGFTGLMVFGKSFAQVLPNILALFLYGAICMTIGVRLFRFREA
ncbi:MAG: ABC transporter permease [Chloroflexota bacterium]